MFCLASAEGAGLLFCLAAYQPHTSPYSGLSAVHAIIRPKRQSRLQGFTAAFPLIWPVPAHAIQQSHKSPIHHLCHAGGHTVKRSICPQYQIPPPRLTLYKSAQPPYYNNVYKGAPMRPCYRFMPARQRLGASHARRGSPAASGRNHWRLVAAFLFGLSPDS